ILPYFAANAWQHLGNKSRAEEMVKKGSICIRDISERYRFAKDLLHLGLREDAEREFELVVKLAPVGAVEWHNAQRNLGDMKVPTQPAAALAHWDQFHVYNIRSHQNTLSPDDVLSVPLRSAYWRARLAIEAGDFATAATEIDAALSINPAA